MKNGTEFPFEEWFERTELRPEEHDARFPPTPSFARLMEYCRSSIIVATSTAAPHRTILGRLEGQERKLNCSTETTSIRVLKAKTTTVETHRAIHNGQTEPCTPLRA